MSTRSTRDTVVARFVAVAIVVPLLFTAVALVLQLTWLPDVPDRIATHWGPDGPDGFGPAWSSLVLTGVLGIGMPALVAALTLPSLLRGVRGWAFRFMGAFSLGMTVYLDVLASGLLWHQRGLADAADAGGSAVAVLASFAAGAVAGVAGYALQPKQASPAPTAIESRPMDLAASERAVWLRTAALRGPMRLVLVVPIVTLLGLLVWIYIDGGLTAMIVPGVVLVGVSLAAASTTVWHVRVDDEGLSVVSALGWPRFTVPAAEVASAGSSPVESFAEFGGFGVRWRPGATGIVLRTGEALRVLKADGKQFVVTVDDAATAASLLEAYARRAGAGAGR